MLLIYQKINDYDYNQKYIEEGASIPQGWTANLDELDIKKVPSETELLKEENELLKKKIEKQEEDITNTQMALAGVFEMVENLV